MISIAPLGNGAAAAEYYLRRQAGCELDYYTGEVERRGVWCGAGSRALGLDGELSERGERTFQGLLAGYGPDGVRVVAPVLRLDPAAKLDARPLVGAIRAAEVEGNRGRSAIVDEKVATALAALERRVDRSEFAAVSVRVDVAEQIARASGIDPEAVYGAEALSSARARLERRIDVRRGGFDVVFSAPKSVSVLYGLAETGVSEQVRQAHAAAIAEALTYLEQHVARAARGHHGDGVAVERIATNGLVAAAFEHRASRADDPQLHTHVVIANLLRGVDGRWSAIDSRALYTHELSAGYVYQAVLRGELTRRLGVGWGDVRRGIAEIDGVPHEVCRAFSQRRQAIEDRLQAQGRADAAAARGVCVDTRPAKTNTPEPTLREQWASRASELGFPADRLAEVLAQTGAPPIDAAAVAGQLLASDGLTGRRSTFGPQDVLRGVCEAVPAGAAVDLPTLLALSRTVIRDDEAVPLLEPTAAGRRAWSTVELLATEQAALAGVELRRAETTTAVVPAHLVAGTLAGHQLSKEQAALVEAVTTRGAGVDIVVGPAGAGKTHALRAAREAWQRAGYDVVGTALAAIAARELERGAGIEARSLARLMVDVERSGLPAGSVLVVDEASMIGTRQLARLLAAADASKAKVVLVGDPCQLSEIEAGGLFAALTRTDGTITLGENHRQAAAWERDALTELRGGDVDAAVTAYAEHDRIHLAATDEQLRAMIVAHLLAARADRKGDVVILTARRLDATRLNFQVRDHLRREGLLGADELTVATAGQDRVFSAGDQVVVTRNDYRRGLLNGTRGTVTAVDQRSRWLELRTDDGRQSRVSADWAGARLEHAYAITCHRAQGMTIDVALLYGTAALCRESAYVALSRGRRANYVYASADQLMPDVDCMLDDMPSLNTADERELVERASESLAAALGRSRRQRLATDSRPDVRSASARPTDRSAGASIDRLPYGRTG